MATPMMVIFMLVVGAVPLLPWMFIVYRAFRNGRALHADPLRRQRFLVCALLLGLFSLPMFGYLFLLGVELQISMSCAAADCAQGGLGLVLFTPVALVCVAACAVVFWVGLRQPKSALPLAAEPNSA
jgi:hypothetical protein